MISRTVKGTCLELRCSAQHPLSTYLKCSFSVTSATFQVLWTHNNWCLLWGASCLPKDCAAVLTPKPGKCDFIWKWETLQV